MAKKKMENYNFVTMPDLKCSYFLVENKKKGDEALALLLRLEEGRHKGIIVEVSKFDILEGTNALTFNYDIVYNPYDKVPRTKTIETFIKKTVSRIVTNALGFALSNEVFDENRDSDSEVVTT
jgi:hypothetical protein